MEKFLKWFIAVFLILHGSVFTAVGIGNRFSGNDSSNIIFILFPIIGLITLSTGLVILIMNIREVKRISKLKISGMEVKAEIMEFKRTFFYINRRPLYRIVAEDGNGEKFLSEARLLKNLERKYKIGDKVTVLVSQEDPKNYTVLL